MKKMYDYTLIMMEFIMLKDTNKFMLKILFIVLISVIAYFGFKIKPMAFIIFIAICVCELKCVMTKIRREGVKF